MLKYLNDRVEEALVAESKSAPPTPSALAAIGRVTPTVLHGFALPEALVQEDRLVRGKAERRYRLALYRDDAVRLQKWLKGIGVEPLAIITAKAFDALIKEMGLFVLQPSSGGKVQINNIPVVACAMPERWYSFTHITTSMLVMGAFFFAFHSWGWSIEPVNGMIWGLSFAAAAALATLIVWNVVCHEVLTRVAKVVFNARAKRWVESRSWEQILTELLPNDSKLFYSPSFDSDSPSKWQRRVVLPPAPPEVIDKVCRIARKNEERDIHGNSGPHYLLFVAAEADAIRFEDGLKGVFDYDVVQAHFAAEAERRRDPILFIRGAERGAVAVIAQYGDLPIEKELIHRIVNSEHLL